MGDTVNTAYREWRPESGLRVNLGEEWVKKLLAEPRVLRLATVGADMQPHVSSAWFVHENGEFLVSTAADRLKAIDVQFNPKVSLIVDTDSMPYRGIIVWGKAWVTRDGVGETTLRIVRKYVPPEHVDSQLRELMQADRVVIGITPVRVMDIMSYKENSRRG